MNSELVNNYLEFARLSSSTCGKSQKCAPQTDHEEHGQPSLLASPSQPVHLPCSTAPWTPENWPEWEWGSTFYFYPRAKINEYETGLGPCAVPPAHAAASWAASATRRMPTLAILANARVVRRHSLVLNAETFPAIHRMTQSMAQERLGTTKMPPSSRSSVW